MSSFPLEKICFSPKEMRGRVKVCYCCPLVRKFVQSAVCWLVKSHYTERQIGSISLPPYANPAC